MHILLIHRRYKGDQELKTGKKYKIVYEKEHATLTVKNTDLADTGKYHCDAKNALGQVDTSGSLTVHSKSKRRILSTVVLRNI